MLEMDSCGLRPTNVLKRRILEYEAGILEQVSLSQLIIELIPCCEFVICRNN
jgi:hypothetical protein